MPSVVAGAIVSAVGLSGIVATVATGALGAVVSMAVGSLTITSAQKRSQTLSAGERIEMLRSGTTPRRVIYGRARTSGALVFAHTTDLGAAKKNHVLHLVLALAGHEVSSIGNLATGDYFTITGKSRTGFTVQFKNAAGTGVVRSYDWVARGYGREQ